MMKPTFLTSLLLSFWLLSAETIPVYDLSGSLSENGQPIPTVSVASFTSDLPLTHLALVQSLEKAAADDDVPGIVLEVDQAAFSLAQIQEISRLLGEVRKADKDVWLYTESLGLKTALLGAHANHLVLLPEGGAMIPGLYTESRYYKGLMDRLGLQADVIHIGDYKSAGESLYRFGPSAAAKKQMDLLLDSTFGQVIEDVSAGRKMEPAALTELIDKGIFTPEQALESGLVDALQYRTDFIKTVREHYGEETDFDKSYKISRSSGPEIDGFMDLVKLVLSKDDGNRFRDPYIAVVVLEGMIDDESISPVRTAILEATKDELCEGLVFRVSSPGGSARSSDVLWEATEEFKATGKPFVVSMGQVAASGGYYISADADRIFAERGTMTGSIGVVAMKLSYRDAFRSFGITTHEYQRGGNANLFRTSSSLTKGQRAIIQEAMKDTYQTFKQRVSDGREGKLSADLESLAGGRVYTGEMALENGLVDEIGGLGEAIAYVKGQIETEGLDTHLLPVPMSPVDQIFSQDDQSDDDEEFITAVHPSTNGSSLTTKLSQISGLKLLPVGEQAELAKVVGQLEMMQSDSVFLISPPLPLLR